jgi:hypothetical protein
VLHQGRILDRHATATAGRYGSSDVCLEGLANAAWMQSRPEPAARMFATAARLREELGAPPPFEENDERALAAIREVLGAAGSRRPGPHAASCRWPGPRRRPAASTATAGLTGPPAILQTDGAPG